MKLPKGYQTVMPYLILGDPEGFINFSKKVFGASELAVYRDDNGNVMHAEIQIGGSTIMIGGSGNQWTVENAGLYINVEDADAVFNNALENGASVLMEMDDKEYGRSGGIKDPFGNTWWITTPGEMK